MARPDHITSVGQLTPGALADYLAPGVLSGTVEDVIRQLAKASHDLEQPVDWTTFRLRVESGPAQGMDTGLRVRGTVDVTP